MLDNLITVGIEPLNEEFHSLDETAGPLQFPVTAKECLNELNPSILAEAGSVLLAGAEHGRLASLQEFRESLGKPGTRFNEVFEDFGFLGVTDLGNDVFGALELAGKLDEQEPELAGHLGDGTGGADVVGSPVIDPLAQRVSVEHRAQEQDRRFGGVPILHRVTQRNLVLHPIRVRSCSDFESGRLVRARWSGSGWSLRRGHGGSTLRLLSRQTHIVVGMLGVETCCISALGLHGVSRLTRRLSRTCPFAIRVRCTRAPPRPAFGFGSTCVGLYIKRRPPSLLRSEAVLKSIPHSKHSGRRALSWFDLLEDPDTRRLRTLGGES